MTGRLGEYIHTLDPWSTPKIEPALIEPFIAPGDLTLLTGPAGSGKSWLALGTACALTIPELEGRIAGGALIADADRFADRRVLVVDGEDTQRRWATRLHRFLSAIDLGPECWEGRIQRVSASKFGLRDPRVTPQVIEATVSEVAGRGVGAIMIDSMLTAFAPQDANAPDWVNRVVVPLHECSRDHDIALLILCHTARKAQTAKKAPHLPLGSTEQEYACDVHLHVRQFRKPHPGIRLTVFKARREDWIVHPSSVRALFTGEGHCEADPSARRTWPLEPTETTASGTALPKRKREYLELLAEAGDRGEPLAELNSRHWTKHGGNALSDATVYDHLRWLSNNGFTRNDGHGPQTRWFITDEGRDVL